MKISLNHIRFYKDKYHWSDDPAPEGTDALVAKIGAQLGAVEEVSPVADRYEGALVVRVVSCEQHPNADRLHICKVDDGGKAKDVERDENGHVQVVCGAPNVHADMVAVWLPPGVTVPSTYYDMDSFVLDTREIRGQKSNGMLASPKELAISDSHEGILELEDEEKDIQPGTPFIEAFGLRDDAIIDMENKMFTHRPDCFGMMGVAREIAGIHGQQFKSPDWYRPDVSIEAPEGPLRVEVHNEIPQLVPRFLAVPMSDVAVKASPVWLQLRLSKLGIRPINNMVDLTNYYMVLTGQPLHAYDYDKVKARSGADHAVIVVRHAQKDEKITILGGKQIALTPEVILIATDKEPIGIGGVMGGVDTEVDEHTKNIIIECANFDMYSIRRTSMQLGVFTDAVTRFTKGQSPLQNAAVVARIVADIKQLAGGALAGKLVDDNHLPADMRERGSVHTPVELSRQFVNERLGLDLAIEHMATLLTNVEFEVSANGDELTVKAPFWRTDVAIAEDVVEEIGRLYGYDHLPLELPQRSITPTPKDPMLALKTQVRDTLSKLGANEVLTYSFVHGNLLDKVGQAREQAFQLSNALSPDLQYYRVSLTPSLLEKVHPNVKADYSRFALFELGKVHNTLEREGEGGQPREINTLAFVFVASDKTAAERYAGAPYYQARTYLMYLLNHFMPALDISLKPLGGEEPDEEPWASQTWPRPKQAMGADLYGQPHLLHLAAPFEPQRSAVLTDTNGRIWGIVGEYRSAVRKALKLPNFAAGFELDPLLLAQTGATTRYNPLSRFPKVEQDICLKVPVEVNYADLRDLVWSLNWEKKGHKDIHFSVTPVDIYQRPDDPAHKQITFRIIAGSDKRTLTDEEVNNLLDQVAQAAKEKFNAERI